MTANHCGLSLVVLRNVPLFAGLEEGELEKLSKVAMRRRSKEPRKTGASVIRSGRRA